MRNLAIVSLVFTLALAILFYPTLQGKHTIAWDFVTANLQPFAGDNPGNPKHGLAVDSAVQWEPFNRLYGEHLKRGVIPLYDPWNRFGNPTVGPTWAGTLNPFKLILFRWFDPGTAHDLLLIIHLFLCGIGCWLFFTRLGADGVGALFGSLAFTFSAHLMVWAPLEFTPVVSAGLPFVLYFLLRAFQEKTLAWSGPAGVVLGLVLLSAHAQWALYAALAALLAVACFAWEFQYSPGTLFPDPSQGSQSPGPTKSNQFFFTVKTLLTLFLLAFLIAAPTLLSLAELSADSERASLSWFEDYTFRNPLQRLLLSFTFLHPGLFGAPDGSSSFYSFFATNANDFQGWAGSITLIFALTAFRLPAPLFLRALWLIAILSAFGTPVYLPIFYLVPGMKQMCATRILYLATFAAAGLAAFTITNLEQLLIRTRLHRLLAGLCFLGALTGLAPALLAHLFPAKIIALGASRAHTLLQLAKLNELVHWWQSSPLYYLPIIVLTITGIVLAGSRAEKNTSQSTSRVQYLFLILLTIEVLAYASHLLPQAAGAYPPRDDLQRLSVLASAYRVAQDGATGNFMPDVLKPYRIHDIGGKGPLYPRPVQEYLSRIEQRNVRSHAALTRFDSHLVTRAGVAYVLSDRENPPGFPEFLAPAADNPFTAPVQLFAVKGAVPRFRIVSKVENVSNLQDAFQWMENPRHDPAQTVCAENFSFNGPAAESVMLLPMPTEDNQLACLVEADKPVYLVILHYLPTGFHAYIDGQEVPWQRTDGIFAGLVVPAGAHEVVFRYQPDLITAGFIFQVSGLIFALFLVLIPSLNPLRKKSGE